MKHEIFAKCVMAGDKIEYCNTWRAVLSVELHQSKTMNREFAVIKVEGDGEVWVESKKRLFAEY